MKKRKKQKSKKEKKVSINYKFIALISQNPNHLFIPKNKKGKESHMDIGQTFLSIVIPVLVLQQEKREEERNEKERERLLNPLCKRRQCPGTSVETVFACYFLVITRTIRKEKKKSLKKTGVYQLQPSFRRENRKEPWEGTSRERKKKNNTPNNPKEGGKWVVCIYMCVCYSIDQPISFKVNPKKSLKTRERKEDRPKKSSPKRTLLHKKAEQAGTCQAHLRGTMVMACFGQTVEQRPQP